MQKNIINMIFIPMMVIFFAILPEILLDNFQAKAEQNNDATLEEVLTKKAEETKIDDNKTEIEQNQKKSTNEDRSTNFGWGEYFQAIGIMLFLLLMLYYVLKLVRKFGDGRFLPAQKLLPKDSMYLEAQLPLGSNKYIALVKVLDKRMLIGVTENSITLIKEMVATNEEDYAKIFEEQLQKPE